MNSSVEITNNNGDIIENPCVIHFDARIEGINVEIENNLIIAE